MIIVKQSWEFEEIPDGDAILMKIEKAARTCYRSEEKVGDKPNLAFIDGLLNRNHLSTIEHASVTVRIITDRGVTHELVRHRLAAYSQESTRYCNYSKDKFGNEISVILPVEFYAAHEARENDPTIKNQYFAWLEGCRRAETAYFEMLNVGASPQLARSVLPNSLKTEIVMSANMREWLHVFGMRSSPAAHPQIRDLMRDMVKTFKESIPVIFDKFAVY